MKLSNKLENPEEIIAHIQELSDFQINIHQFTREGEFLSKGTFYCEFEAGNGFCFSSVPPNGIEYPAIAYHYSYKVNACAFQARPIKVENNRLYLQLPSSVLFFDRRKYFRVEPSKRYPVIIRLVVEEKGEVRFHAGDISGGGLSILAPVQMNFLGIDKTFPVQVELPSGEKIQCLSLIKGVFTFLDVMRIGFELTELNERGRASIVSYCVRRELEIRNKPEIKTNELKRLQLCIVDGQPQNNNPYSYLEKFFNINTVDPLNAISHLRQHPPDIIMLNTDHAGIRLILQTVTRDPILKDTPLVLLGKKSTVTQERSGHVISIKKPYKNEFLLKCLNDLVDNLETSKQVSRYLWGYFMGEGKKIVVVDPQRNLGSFPSKSLMDLEFQVHWIKEEVGIIGQLEASRPDVIMIDSGTGAVDPGTLCRMMGLNRTLKNVPKIRLISGCQLTQSKLFDQTGIFFLNKPFDFHKLIEAIHGALGKSI